MEKVQTLDGNYEADDLVSVWVGTFPSEAAFHAYLEESWPDNEDGDEPVHCPFWKDLGITWYDHDFQEVSYEPEVVDITTLLRPELSWSESYKDAVQQACQAQGISHANAIVLLFEYDYPREASFQSDYLTYIGSFPYSTGSRSSRRDYRG